MEVFNNYTTIPKFRVSKIFVLFLCCLKKYSKIYVNNFSILMHFDLFLR